VLELARLEGLIREDPRVRECLVADIETPGGGRLRVAYLVAVAPTAPPDIQAVRRAADLLAPSALPDAVVLLPSLPRTRAGKIDRAHLPLPPAHDGVGAGLKGGRAGSLKGGRPARGSAALNGCLVFVLIFIVGLIVVWVLSRVH